MLDDVLDADDHTFEKFRIYRYFIRIWNENEECLKTSTNKQ